MAKVVSFINYKGGVGKTTMSVEMAASLAHHQKKRVLLADLDPQTNATFYLSTPEDWQAWAKEKGTLKDIFTSVLSNSPGEFDPHFVVNRNILKSFPKFKDVTLDLLPSHLELMTADLELASRFGVNGFEGRKILRAAFSKLQDEYDYIICDCPPNLNLITQNAILASDAVIIIAMAEYLSVIGIKEIQKAIHRIVDDMKRNLEGFADFEGPEIKGILFNRISTKAGGNNNEKMNMAYVKITWPSLVFDTFVSQSTLIAGSAEPTRLPISISGLSADKVYKEQFTGCMAEFLERMGE